MPKGSCRIGGILKESQKRYQEYLKSDHWANLKRQKSKRGKKRCEGCKTRVKLQLHHMIYRENWKETELLDLCWLCGPCHKKFHARFGIKIDLPKGLNRPWLRKKTGELIRGKLKRNKPEPWEEGIEIISKEVLKAQRLVALGGAIPQGVVVVNRRLV